MIYARAHAVGVRTRLRIDRCALRKLYRFYLPVRSNGEIEAWTASTVRIGIEPCRSEANEVTVHTEKKSLLHWEK